MSKSQKTLALAAKAPHLLGEKGMAKVAQAVRDNRVGAASPIKHWELKSQIIGGVWYRSLSFSTFAAYKAAKAARARMARNDALASVTRVDDTTRPACTGGRSYGVAKRPVNRPDFVVCDVMSDNCEGSAQQDFLFVEAPVFIGENGAMTSDPCVLAPAVTWGTSLVLPAAAPVKVKAPQTVIPRQVREVAAHVRWCLSEAASAARARAKVARKAAKKAVKVVVKAKSEKVGKKAKAVRALKALQAAKNPQVQGAPVVMATKAELLRAWNRA